MNPTTRYREKHGQGSDKQKMRKSEQIAHEYLISIGYKEENIHYDTASSPDFIAAKIKKGKTRYSGWEVKTLPVVFSKAQSALMEYNTNIIVVDEQKVLYHKRFYEFIISNHLKYNSRIGITDICINGVNETGYFHPVITYEWTEDSRCITWQQLMRKLNLPSLFGLYQQSKVLNRTGHLNIELDDLEKIRDNIRDYFNNMNEREEQYMKLRETVWWIP